MGIIPVKARGFERARLGVNYLLALAAITVMSAPAHSMAVLSAKYIAAKCWPVDHGSFIGSGVPTNGHIAASAIIIVAKPSAENITLVISFTLSRLVGNNSR